MAQKDLLTIFANAAVPIRLRKGWKGIAVAVCITSAAICNAQTDVEITLKNSFIEKYKNRATINANLVVDRAHAHPNPASKDGDLHIAGRSPEEIALPIVAEIMNARSEKDAVSLIHQVEGSGRTVNVAGAWRIWCEHGGLFRPEVLTWGHLTRSLWPPPTTKRAMSKAKSNGRSDGI